MKIRVKSSVNFTTTEMCNTRIPTRHRTKKLVVASQISNVKSSNTEDRLLPQEPDTTTLIAGLFIGSGTGAGVVFLNWAIDYIQLFNDYEQHLLFSPIIGGFLVGLLSLARQKGGAIIQFVQAAITLGSGASLGPEGPSVNIGQQTSSLIAKVLGEKDEKFYLGAGCGAGVSAGFNAPIAGVFFAVETVLLGREGSKYYSNKQTNEKGQIVVVLLACVTAAIVSQIGLGSQPAFLVPQYRLESYWEIPFYGILGLLCGIFSLVSNELLSVLNVYRPRISNVYLPVLGGAICGGLATLVPEISYRGFDNVNLLLQLPEAGYTFELLLECALLKVVATAACRASGLVGGLYAPSIFIGVALGSAFGIFIQSTIGTDTSTAYALVGCAAMLAGICRVPLTAIILLFELTRDYNIILPTIAAVGLSFWTSSIQLFPPQREKISKQISDAKASYLFLDEMAINKVLVGERVQKKLVDDSGEFVSEVIIEKID